MSMIKPITTRVVKRIFENEQETSVTITNENSKEEKAKKKYKA